MAYVLCSTCLRPISLSPWLSGLWSTFSSVTVVSSLLLQNVCGPPHSSNAPIKPIPPVPWLKHHSLRKSLLTPSSPSTSLGDQVLCHMLAENHAPFLQNTYPNFQLFHYIYFLLWLWATWQQGPHHSLFIIIFPASTTVLVSSSSNVI